MEGSKQPLNSLTIQSGLVILVITVGKLFEIDLDEGNITEAVASLITLIAAGTAIYGRARAKTIIE